MEKKIGDKTYVVNEIAYVQGIEIEEIKQKDGLAAAAKAMLKFATELTDEEIKNLSLKEGLELQKAINEVNDFDFQNPAVEEKQK